MKTLKVIAKLAVVLAAIAGAVYVVATYGNQIVAWCKKLLASLPCCCNEVELTEEAVEEAVEAEAVPAEEVAEEVPAEEAAEEPAAEEVPAEETVAEEKDFEA